jgi:uncharacterized damage-inducible protein DinB
MELVEQIIDSWNIHNRINLYVLEAVSVEALSGVSASKGRNVGEMIAHIHNVRLMWLKAARPELLEGLVKIEKEQAQDKKLLRQSLEESGKALATLLQKGLDAGGKIKGFKPHLTGFLGYIISHESYHLGEIGMTLTQAGYPLDKNVAFGIWEWGVR